MQILADLEHASPVRQVVRLEIESVDRNVITVADVTCRLEHLAQRCGRLTEQRRLVEHQLPDNGIEGVSTGVGEDRPQTLAESGCGIQYLGDGAECQLTVSDEQSDQVTYRALGKGVGVEQKAFVVWELRIFNPTISQKIVVGPAVHDADAVDFVVVTIEENPQHHQIGVRVENAGPDFRFGEPMGQHSMLEQRVEGGVPFLTQVSEQRVLDVLDEFGHVLGCTVPGVSQQGAPVRRCLRAVLTQQLHRGFGDQVIGIHRFVHLSNFNGVDSIHRHRSSVE